MKSFKSSVTKFNKSVSLFVACSGASLALLGLFALVSPRASANPASTSAAPTAAAGNPEIRVIEVKTEKIGEAVHWMPENVEVKQGEKVKFVVKHELVGGFDFHGFTVSELKIAKRVDRNKTLEFETTIPKDLKAGSYKITCQFHPKHMPAGFIIVQPSK